MQVKLKFAKKVCVFHLITYPQWSITLTTHSPGTISLLTVCVKQTCIYIYLSLAILCNDAFPVISFLKPLWAYATLIYT